MTTTPNLGLPHMNPTLTTAGAKIDLWNQILVGVSPSTKGFTHMFYLTVIDVSSFNDPYDFSAPLFPGVYYFAGNQSANLNLKLLDQKGFYLFLNGVASSPASNLTVQMGTGSPFTGGNIYTIPADGKFHLVYADGNGNLYSSS